VSNTNLRVCINIHDMDPFALQIVLHVSIGHEGQDNIWGGVRGIETHSKETQDVGMAEIFHKETFRKESRYFVLSQKVCVCV